MRLWGISDLHVDYRENLDWVKALSRLDYTSDVLLLGGDISSNEGLMQEALEALQERFGQIFFVPGNHDLWVRPEEKITSIDRYLDLDKLVHSLGISTTPAAVGDYYIVPMLGWYDYSFGQPGSKIKKLWADFRMCRWPDDWTLQEVTNWFVQRNSLPSPEEIGGRKVISFSHFLPSSDVLPRRVVASMYFLTPVLGTNALLEQIKQFQPVCHLFGHSHLNTRRDISGRHPELKGTTFLNNAYGYPKEAAHCRKELIELEF